MDLKGHVAQGSKIADRIAWLRYGGGLTRGARSSDCAQRNQLSYFSFLFLCALTYAEQQVCSLLLDLNVPLMASGTAVQLQETHSYTVLARLLVEHLRNTTKRLYPSIPAWVTNLHLIKYNLHATNTFIPSQLMDQH